MSDLRAELIAYSEDVIAGRVTACTKHRWACMRFLRDIAAEGTAEFPFVFLPAKAERFFAWVGLFKHRKGILKGEPIKPNIINKFIFGNVYGWYHKKTMRRRFNKFYWQVARKNGKSQWLACVGSYETMGLDETGLEAMEVFCAATKTEQAKIVYDEAVAMLNGNPNFKGKYTVAYGRIKHKKTGSMMRALSEEDRKTGDGLNVQCGIIDEYHAHESSEIYDVIDSGMGARAQPLLGIITTAGFELTNPCYRVEYDLVSKILDPDNPINLDHYFAMVNELDKDSDGNVIDDIKDTACWEKANPIVCSYAEGRDYLKKKLDEAMEAPEKMKNFLTKHMNVWVNQREHGYIMMDRWTACGAEPVDMRGKRCFIGLDLSSKLDLTSVAFEFPVEDQYYVRSHSFIPSETLEQKTKTDKVPYGMWADQGWITVTSGPVVDYTAVFDYIMTQIKLYDLKVAEVCLDPWGAVQISSDMIDEGLTVVEIIQGIKTLSEPTKNFREMVYLKRVIHDRNPVLTWSLSNAIADIVDRNQNIILSKKKSKQRIDPIAALINAHVRAMVAPVSSGGRVFFA